MNKNYLYYFCVLMTTLISVNCIVAGGNNMWVPGDSLSKVCNNIFIQSFANAPVNFFGGFFISWFIPCRNTCTMLYRKLQICSHLLKKSLIEKFIFCTMVVPDLRFVVVEKTLKACYILKTVKKPIQAFFNCFKNSNPLKTKN